MPFSIRYTLYPSPFLSSPPVARSSFLLSSPPSASPSIGNSPTVSSLLRLHGGSELIGSAFPIDAVFFSSKCGVARGSNPLLPEQGLSADEEESDTRCCSVGAAVQFAKSNNLLGVLLNANLLVSLSLCFSSLPPSCANEIYPPGGNPFARARDQGTRRPSRRIWISGSARKIEQCIRKFSP